MRQPGWKLAQHGFGVRDGGDADVVTLQAPKDYYVDQAGDIDWYQHESVSLLLADGLSEELRNAVRRDSGFPGRRSARNGPARGRSSGTAQA